MENQKLKRKERNLINKLFPEIELFNYLEKIFGVDAIVGIFLNKRTFVIRIAKKINNRKLLSIVNKYLPKIEERAGRKLKVEIK